VFVLEEFEESRDISARRLLANLHDVWSPEVATVGRYINLYLPKHGRNHRENDRYIRQKERN